MSDDDLDALMNELSAADESEDSGIEAEVSVVEVEAILNDEVQVEEYTMTADQSDDYDTEESPITQAEVYENLKRIGELEDEKLAIQEELRRRTEQLRSVLKHIDRGSILYRMLTSALPGSTPPASSARSSKKSAAKPAVEKVAKKKGASPAAKNSAAKPKAKKPAKKKARR